MSDAESGRTTGPAPSASGAPGNPPEPRRIVVESRVPAPPETVFKVLTEPSELARWFPLEADVDPRPGGTVRLSWGPGMAGEAPIHAFEPPTRFGWTERMTDADGNAVDLSVDFVVEAASGGVTVVRLTQSGFGPGDDWDDMFDALQDGWRYFLYNLGHYLRHHRGRPRDMVWRRHATALDRAGQWRRLTGDAGLIRAGALAAGADCQVHLGPARPARLVSLRPQHHLAAVLPELNQSLLFVEQEGRHVGLWLSTYGLPGTAVAALQAALDQWAETQLASE